MSGTTFAHLYVSVTTVPRLLPSARGAPVPWTPGWLTRTPEFVQVVAELAPEAELPPDSCEALSRLDVAQRLCRGEARALAVSRLAQCGLPGLGGHTMRVLTSGG